jgi:glutamate formiminotransferase
MPLLAVPNVSEGRRLDVVSALVDRIDANGGIVFDRHADAAHNRAVLTVGGDLLRSMGELAIAARDMIDLTRHDGVHPRLGALDVCPIVPYREPAEAARELAEQVGRALGDAGIPVFLYGAAARRAETRHLPGLRRGGLAGIVQRIAGGLAPDFGPPEVDPRTGVTCVGARGPLIAFNVWLEGDASVAAAIAARVRTSGGGPPGVRALGLAMGDRGHAQVSMNLTDPATTGIDRVFEAVEALAEKEGVRIAATEIVGLVEERFLPKGKAARLLMAPGRSVESALQG